MYIFSTCYKSESIEKRERNSLLFSVLHDLLSIFYDIIFDYGNICLNSIFFNEVRKDDISSEVKYCERSDSLNPFVVL